MANHFSAVEKINPRGVVDSCLEIFVDTADIYRLNNLVAELDTYTFVVWYCSAAECSIKFNVLGTEETVKSTPTWTKYVKTVEYDGTNNNIDITQDLDSTIYLYEGYITKGSKDKSWSLAPEDWEDGREERDNLITETMTFAQQTSDMFRWLVKDGTNETNFTLTSRTADLVSEQINLKGLVTFTGLSSDVPTEIIGEFSKAPIVNEGDDGSTNATVIHGGWIKTGTIDTNQLNVEEIFASGTSVMNIIDAREINADNITSGTIKSNFIELYGLEVKQNDTDIVTLSIENTGDVTLRGSVESYNYVTGESGWSINAYGDAEFNDVTVRGNLINKSAGIIATDGDDRQIVAWFGSSYEERESAPLIFYSDGYMKSSTGEFGGIFTGDIKIGNISIVDPNENSGSDALLTIQNGNNGVKKVQLRDTNESSFAQNIVITNEFYNTSIMLNQDGSGYFKGISVVDYDDNNEATTYVSMQKNGLNINGISMNGTLIDGENTFSITSQKPLDINITANNTHISGTTTVDKLEIENEGIFGKIKM